MAVFSRGPVCGTNNCKSNLWRSIDGRQVCQYGHVLDGTILEIEESFKVVSGALKFSQFSQNYSQKQQQSQKKNDDLRLHGEEGKEYYLHCFQYILKAQLDWLVKKGVPDSVQGVARSLWFIYLQSLDEKKTIREPSYVPLIHSVVICYLACLKLHFPLFVSDFIRSCSSGELPYIRAYRAIPEDMRSKLPTHFSLVTNPGTAPSSGEFFDGLDRVLSKLKPHSSTNGWRPCFKVLLIRIVKELCLPKHIYLLVANIISELGLSFALNDVSYRTILHKSYKHNVFLKSPEIRLVCLVITMTKVFFAASRAVDWRQWARDVRSRKASEFVDVLNFVTRNVNAAEETEILRKAFAFDINGNDSGNIEEYLDWFDSVMVNEKQDLTIPEKRLASIFEYETEKEVGAAEVRRSVEVGVEKVGEKEVNKIMKILVEELSINFGVSEDQLRKAVVIWSDRLVLEWAMRAKSG